ncbi:phosphotransferase [Paenibacillus sp. Aloe-11]|uniref:phosphotransferase n=1 Tax=Paenibacillus sp. Aloe-11 TaxID=1050222 RepID=UPI00024EF70D|nr:phosphotransferase [Paenibacillus sp. Aloe-11]EHS58347.1 spore coat protein cots like protein [Paenibacillus sp. Aloe-11]
MSILSNVEQMYGIKIQRARQKKDIHKIETASMTYCLKPYNFPEDEIRFITHVLSFLDERGFTRSQKVYPTVQQTAYMTHEGVSYTLTNWVDGQRPKFTKRIDFKKGICTLAKFHSSAVGFPVSEAPAARIRYEGLGDEIAGYKKRLSPYKGTAHLVALCEEVTHRLQQPKVREAIDSEQKAGAFIHGDYNYPNLIKDRQLKIHLIDFENCSLHVRMKDLSHLLHRNCLWNGTKMLRAVDYYQRYRPLSPRDLHLLHALLISPYHVVRNIRIAGIRSAKRVIPSLAQLNKYRRELRALL